MPLDDAPNTDAPATLPLDDLQGNVARGYTFPVAHFSFWRFVSEPARARTWLGALLEVVTAGTPWSAEKPRTTLNVAFTHSGLAALGLAQPSLLSFPQEFREGMATPERAVELGDVGDSDPRHWDFGNPDQPLDVMLAIHGQTSQEVSERLELLRAANAQVLAEVYALPAAVLAPDPRREHFGFRDGFGQPSIAGSGVASVPGQGTPEEGKWRDVNPGEFILGHDDESGGQLKPLPQPPELGTNGTFLVFRKLYQDVAQFRQALAQRARAVLGADNEANREWLASRWVGRWRSGAPVALCPDRDDPALAEDWNRTLD
ncbi:MAG TPA: hypothetical protein VNN80_22980, partial [Polyangiaceae bacterium]|nr:hypothetical protein [Polyangiaceae bacterium]